MSFCLKKKLRRSKTNDREQRNIPQSIENYRTSERWFLNGVQYTEEEYWIHLKYKAFK